MTLPKEGTFFTSQMEYAKSGKHQYKLNYTKTPYFKPTNYYSFRKAEEYILNKMGISKESCEYSRIDFAFDTGNDDFDEYFKLNKCLILLIAEAYCIENRYEDTDPLTHKKKSICIKPQYFEIQNYNKYLENPDDPAKNRLELRSKRIRGKAVPDLINQWIKRIQDLPKYYKGVQKNCNEELLKRWIEEYSIGKVRGIYEFLRKYDTNIYSSKQLESFFTEIGTENPRKSAYNFKSNSKNVIEYYSYKDLKEYIKILITEFERFLH